ncbi:MAG: hypothetical protein AAGC83_06795, partial [Pseudomonadota bacterium]
MTQRRLSQPGWRGFPSSAVIKCDNLVCSIVISRPEGELPTRTSIAYLLPVHDAVDANELALALESIDDQVLPMGVELRLYIGIDGKIDIQKQALILKHSPYKTISLDQRSGLPVVLNRLIDCLEDEAFIFRMDADDIN